MLRFGMWKSDLEPSLKMSNVKLLPSISRSDPEKDFELLKQIGSGTLGDAFKVTHYTTGYFIYCPIII